MFSLGRQRPCLHHANYFRTNFTRQKHATSSRYSYLRPTWILGGVITGTFAAFLYGNPRSPRFRELSPSYFIPTTLTSSEDTSKNSKLIRLNLPSESSPDTPIAIWAVYVKDSDIMVERPYTPLEGLTSSGDMLFWIKKYTHGEVGRWLHSKTIGDVVEIRGPEQTWAWREGAWDNIIMIGGGTGVAPFYQLLHSLLSNKDFTPTSKFILLHSHRSSELPPDFVLDNLRSWENSYPEHLKVVTYLDKLDPVASRSDHKKGRISQAEIESALKQASKRPGKTIVLVCGPESMVNEIAGPKGRDESQGPIGGTLGRMRDHKFEVFKL